MPKQMEAKAIDAIKKFIVIIDTISNVVIILTIFSSS
jgi:hypothetical protein